jgi:hypothetical protein
VGTGGVRDLEELAHTYNKVIGYTDLSQIVQAERPMKHVAGHLIGQRGSDPAASPTPVSTKRPSLLLWDEEERCLRQHVVADALREWEQSELPDYEGAGGSGDGPDYTGRRASRRRRRVRSRPQRDGSVRETS